MPIYFFNQAKGWYYKINSPEGDGVVVDFVNISIMLGCKYTLNIIHNLPAMERIEAGYIPISADLFNEMYFKVQEHINKQLIKIANG